MKDKQENINLFALFFRFPIVISELIMTGFTALAFVEKLRVVNIADFVTYLWNIDNIRAKLLQVRFYPQ